MTTVAEFFASLKLVPDDGSFAKGTGLLNGIGAAAGKLGGLLAGAFAVGNIAGFVRETISALPAITDLSDQTNVSVDAIQSLGFAASQSGADAQVLQAALIKLTRNIGDAAKGSGPAADSFAALGIKLKGTNGRIKDTDKVLLEMADALAKIPDTAKRADKATELLGKQGASLVPFLAQGSGAIAELQAEARALGLVLDESTIRKFDEVDDRLNKAKATAIGAARSFVVNMLPALESLSEALVEIAKSLTKAPALIRRYSTALKVLGVLVGSFLVAKLAMAAAAFVALTVAELATAAASTQALPGAFFFLIGVIDVLIAKVSALAARFFIMAAPIIAVAGVIALLVFIAEDLFRLLTGGDSLIGRLSGRFAELAIALADVVTDPTAHPLVRFFAAIGTVAALAFDTIDRGIALFFTGLEKLLALKDIVVGLFVDPVATLRALLADLSSLVASTAQVGARIASAVGADSVAKQLGAIDAGSLTRVATGAVETATTTLSTASNAITVGAPSFEIVVNGASDPQATANGIMQVAGDALQSVIRAAAVDNLPDAG